MIDLLHAYRISKRREIVDTHSHAVAVVMGIALRVSRQPTTSPSVQFTSPHVFFFFFFTIFCAAAPAGYVGLMFPAGATRLMACHTFYSATTSKW